MKLKFWGVKTLTIHVVTGTFPSEVGAKNKSDLVSWLIIPLNNTGLNGNFFSQHLTYGLSVVLYL